MHSLCIRINMRTWCLFVLFSVKCGIVDKVNADCSLSLDKDFSQPSPLFLKNGGLLAPNSKGIVTLRRSDTLLVACPGDRRQITLDNNTSGYNELEAHCIQNNTFRIDRWTGQFKSIKCNTQPWFTTEETTEKCHKNKKLYRVGYKLRKTFVTLYEACFDNALMSTLYVSHELTPDNKHLQPGPRPNFVEGSLFGKVRMSDLYKFKKQIERLNNVLGANMSQTYITKKQFLTRGHLAPRADFPLRAEQQASFHYVNTAPQWMRGNAGDWAALEEALRRRVQKLSRPVTVYTGTHNIVTLADNAGRMIPIYLDVDANNNEVVPVPLYFYKLVYDPKTKKATAFVSINSSYYSDDMIKNLTFCDDICGGNQDFNWLRWRAKDGTFSFCCSYEQFVEEVVQLPRLDVNGVFY